MSHSDQPKHTIHPSRRQVIAGAGAGLGLVATGALAGAAGTAIASGASGASGDSGAHETQGSGEPVVAHVRDASTGDIDVYFGDQQVRIRDRAVAARLSSVTS